MIRKITLLLCMFQCAFMFGQMEQTLTLGTEGTGSGSATRGPFQRSDTGSSSVFSRASLHYSAAELTGTGRLTSTSTITEISFDLGSSNTITAPTGDAVMNIYMKNSTATEVSANPTDWDNIVMGATLVGTYTFNLANNFPGSQGFMSFELDSDFAYTGGSLEIAVDWDASQLVPADAMAPNQLFSGNGSLSWRWNATTQQSVLNRAGSSGFPTSLNSRKAERVNTQISFIDSDPSADQTLTLGTEGTGSGSATRGPFQRSDIGSSSVFSRASLHYSTAELSTLTSGATITQVNFDLGSSNTITAPTGDAVMNIYMKNSTATEVSANPTDWDNIVMGATLVGTYTFNLANNFPGSQGFMSFALDSNFTYTGGALEIAVDWDASQLVPADAMAPNQLFSGNGALNWRWNATTQQSVLNRAGSSGFPTSLNSRKAERVNTQIIFNLGALSLNDNELTTFRLSPNPATNSITISSMNTIDSVEMYDLLGKQMNVSLNGNTVDISNLSSAIYLVRITSGNAIEVKRLVKK